MMSPMTDIGYKWPHLPCAPRRTSFSPTTMARNTAASTSSKDPSKLTRAELLQLYTSTIAAKEDLTKKYGWYPHVSRGEVWQMSVSQQLTHLFCSRSASKEAQTCENGSRDQPGPRCTGE